MEKWVNKRTSAFIYFTATFKDPVGRAESQDYQRILEYFYMQHFLFFYHLPSLKFSLLPLWFLLYNSLPSHPWLPCPDTFLPYFLNSMYQFLLSTFPVPSFCTNSFPIARFCPYSYFFYLFILLIFSYALPYILLSSIPSQIFPLLSSFQVPRYLPSLPLSSFHIQLSFIHLQSFVSVHIKFPLIFFSFLFLSSISSLLPSFSTFLSFP